MFPICGFVRKYANGRSVIKSTPDTKSALRKYFQRVFSKVFECRSMKAVSKKLTKLFRRMCVSVLPDGMYFGKF
jgi:hypothetical protein